DLSIGFGDKKKPFGKMIVTAPVGDKVSLNKVLDKVVEAGFLLKKGDVYTENNFSKTFGLFVRIDDKNLTIASDSLTYQQYFSKTQKANIAA
ncbi:hypothetical protein ACE4ZU_26380, partial [Salmonella enterica]|uniref:hypothetical protein n=1 Tax=Salmonella enterica TaxID=28901 RepID=UPI003D2A83D7